MDRRLLALSFGNFMIGTGTLIVPGMLPVLAHGLSVDVPVAAQLITAFAFTVCVTAPLLAALTARFDRRSLLVTVQLLFAAGHVASAFVIGYRTLFALRVFLSLGAALFTAQAAATAGLLAAPDRRGGAIALVFVGWSIASVAGMPLGAYVGETLGWRAGFALVGAGALIAAGALRLTIPPALFVAPIDRGMWGALFGSLPLMLTIAVTAVQAAAQFTVFSFLVPAFKAFGTATPLAVSALLALFGITGVIGNVVGARMLDRFGAPRVILAALLSMLAGHLLWPFAGRSLAVLVASLLLWGVGCFSTNSAQQARLVFLSPSHAPVSIAMNSSAIYLGQALGTAAGGALLAGGAGRYADLAWLSIPVFVLAIVLSLVAERESVRAVAPAR
ncbi:MAG TPA: MFS transporter [Burkholderiales bacterium]|nr:MFS transporter [Burkholderiales bacterium]